MKVLLTTLNTKYVHTNIALRYLENACKENEFISKNCEVIRKEFSMNDLIENIIAEITDTQPDVIAFSVYIWNVEMILKIAETLKKIKPEIKIILGGPEVTYRSNKLLEEKSFLDFICVGEGEESFPNLIQWLQEKEEREKDVTLGKRKEIHLNCDQEENISEKLSHITYRNGTKIVVGELACVKDMTKIPRIAQGIAEEYDGKIVYIETVRGCPYHCSYCLSSTIKGIRAFPMERVKEELKILMEREVRLIKFVDRTFNYQKQRAIEIWSYILENNISSQFHFELSAHLMDDEMMAFLEKVPKDVFQFEIGVQSTNAETILAIHRTTDFKILSNRVKQLAKMKTIRLHLDLIAGLPYENLQSFQNSFDDVYALQPTELQLGFLKMLDGTQIRKEEEKFHYVYTSFPPYEVLQNDFISYEELKHLKRFETVFDWYYNSARFQNVLSFLLENDISPFQFYNSLTNYYIQNHLLERKIATEEQFDILADFYQNVWWKEKEQKEERKEQFIQYLKYDFVLHFHTKRSWMPQYDSKWLKQKIDEKVAEMIPFERDVNLYKKYKFEMFEIDLQTRNKMQHLVILEREK